MKRPKGPRVGRPFVMDHTQRLLDAPLLMAGNAARLAYLDLRLLSAANGDEGHFSKNARQLDFSLRLDGGATEVATAVEALAEAGKVVDAGDTWFITDWDDTQFDMGGSKTRSETSKSSQLARRHNEGKHVGEVREGCDLCAQGVPSVVPVDDAEAQRATDDGGLFPEPEKTTTPVKMNATQLKKDFVAMFDEVFGAMPRLDGYRYLMTVAEELSAANAGLSKNLRGNLMNAILSNSLEHYMGDFFTDPKQYTRALGGAKALNEKDGYWWWLLAAQSSAAADINGDAVSYLQRTAANKRSEWLGTGVAA